MSDMPLQVLLLLAIAVLLRLDFAYYIVYVLAGAFILARAWTARSLTALRVTRRFTDHIFPGEHIPVELHLENRSWRPVPWLRCEEAPPPVLSTGSAVRTVIALRPREQLTLRYELAGHRRGYYEIGPATFSTGDLFGFAEGQGRLEDSDHLTVYPRVIPLADVPLTSHAPYGTIKSRQPIFADPARVIGVRDYTPGDPPHSVAWKSSARAGRLQVNKVEPAVSLTSVVFLDLHTPAYARQLRSETGEWAIVVAASLAVHLIERRQAAGLASNGLDPLSGARPWMIPPRTGRTHLMKLLEWLARVQMTETTPLAEWLTTAAAGLAWGTTVIAVTPTGDEATCTALHRLRRAGLNPVLAAIEPHGQFGVVRERARRLGVAAHLAADERDLARWAAVLRGATNGV